MQRETAIGAPSFSAPGKLVLTNVDTDYKSDYNMLAKSQKSRGTTMAIHALQVLSNFIAIEHDIKLDLAEALVSQCCVLLFAIAHLEPAERTIFVNEMVISWKWLAPCVGISEAKMRSIMSGTIPRASDAMFAQSETQS